MSGPPVRSGPSARAQKRLRVDAYGGDDRFKRRVERAFPEEPKLDLWLELTASLTDEDIVPTRLRSTNQHHVSTNNVELNALIGDKILGAYLLEELVSHGLVRDTGEATRQYSNLASNRVFAGFALEVLPGRVNEADIVGGENHSAGTSVEAAVYMVSKMPGGTQAIQQLARWFVYNVVVAARFEGEIMNPKGLLIELHGETTAERLTGTPDHDPRFEAFARWPLVPIPGVQTRQTRAVGRSKKEAESAAAKEMLELYGHEIHNATPQEDAKSRKQNARLENAYGHLLTLGGVMVGECENIAPPGTSPVFVATMRLGADQARAEASTKKQAQRLASQKLLEMVGEYDD